MNWTTWAFSPQSRYRVCAARSRLKIWQNWVFVAVVICPSTRGATEQDLCCELGHFTLGCLLFASSVPLVSLSRIEWATLAEDRKEKGRGQGKTHLQPCKLLQKHTPCKARKAPSMYLPSAIEEAGDHFNPQSLFFISCYNCFCL